MGALASRQNVGVEEVDLAANHAYRYPPKSGSYFGSHFIMGGERFDTPQPEAYLFGENSDLNFLGNKPTPFPYPAPQPNEPTKTLRSLVNIRKESLRFVKVADDANPNVTSRDNGSATERKPMSSTRYNIEFTFDSDIRCAITIHYFCAEEITLSGANYIPRDPSMNSETYHYKSGANQQFCQVSHVFDPSLFTDEELNYSFEKEILPVVIQCVAEEGDDPKQSHMTVAVVEKNSDGTYSLKALKQKQYVDGLCYLLQEIYGIENKNAECSKTATDDEVEDNGSECVICMCDIRDTLILPCRHLCLCNCCADSLRYQANNCPICRAPFRALLQIRALRKVTAGGGNQTSTADGGQAPKSESVPHGYEAVGLIEALNGPSSHIPSVPSSALRLVPASAPILSSVSPVPILPTAPPLSDLPTAPPLSDLPTAPPLSDLPTAHPLSLEMTVSLPAAQQDAVTSPALPVPVDSTNCHNYTGSFSSIRVAATMEDCAAQTDCPPDFSSDNLTPEICLSVMLPDSPEKEGKNGGGGGGRGRTDGYKDVALLAAKTTAKSKPKPQCSRTSSLDKVFVVNEDAPTNAPSPNLKRAAEPSIVDHTIRVPTVQSLSEAHSLKEFRSPIVTALSRKPDKMISASTPDSLHLCENAEHQGSLNAVYGQPASTQTTAGDLSPGGEESDYYTPEDPNTTILTEERNVTVPRTNESFDADTDTDTAAAVIIGDGCGCGGGGGGGGTDSDGGGLVDELEEGTPLKGALPTYIEAISLPGTPLSHGSNRSSGDSFSSMSSTRLLLPNQSQETLAEDRMLI